MTTLQQRHEKELESREELGNATSEKSKRSLDGTDEALSTEHGVQSGPEEKANQSQENGIALQKTKSYVDVPPNGGYGW
jgi:hypothetical protein